MTKYEITYEARGSEGRLRGYEVTSCKVDGSFVSLMDFKNFNDVILEGEEFAARVKASELTIILERPNVKSKAQVISELAHLEKAD